MTAPKTIVLTGASAGIGAAAARALRDAGHDVVVVGRSPERTVAVANELGAKHFLVEFEQALSVRDLAANLLAELPRIDVLALNAGAIYSERRLTVDGHERTWQTNVLGPTLLARILMRRIRASEGRVIVTTSDIYRFARLEPSDIEGHRSSYSMLRAYGNAKLAGLLILDEAAKHSEGADVAFSAFHPGVVATDVFRERSIVHALVNSPLSRRFLRTPEEGAMPLTYLATESNVESIHNTYWHRMRERRIQHPQWQDVRLRSALREAVEAFDTAIV